MLLHVMFVEVLPIALALAALANLTLQLIVCCPLALLLCHFCCGFRLTLVGVSAVFWLRIGIVIWGLVRVRTCEFSILCCGLIGRAYGWRVFVIYVGVESFVYALHMRMVVHCQRRALLMPLLFHPCTSLVLA